MKELRVIIAGSRDFSDYELLKKSAIEIITKKTMLPDLTRIVSGGARGADTLGERFANEMGLSKVVAMTVTEISSLPISKG